MAISLIGSSISHCQVWEMIFVKELLTFQLLKQLQSIWEQGQVPLWIKPHKILVISVDSSVIGPVVNTVHLPGKETDSPPCPITSCRSMAVTPEAFLSTQHNFMQN